MGAAAPPPPPPLNDWGVLIEEPQVAASTQQLIDHTNADGNTLRVAMIKEVTLFQNYLATVVEELESLLEESDEQAQAEINSVISQLYHKARAWQNKKAVAEHGLGAHARLQELQHFNESKGAWEKYRVVADPENIAFTKGVTSSSTTSVRLLIKVDLLVHMMRNGALDQKGVKFNIGRAEEMDNEVFFIKRGEYIPMQFKHITQGPDGFFKMLELSAKFETEIERYSFRNIPKASDDEKMCFSSSLRMW